ncbi:MAG: rubrerythrin family protein [Paraperlucidibaca sp.]
MNLAITVTGKNLEAAFAGESMAFMKYSYFAKLARASGDEATAKAFEDTAQQEIQHAFGHLDLLYPKVTMTSEKMLEVAIAGETYEYTEMYPTFHETAVKEQNVDAMKEFEEQIAESEEHAEWFKAALKKAEKRFAALAKVEERHAKHYREALAAAQAR